MILLGFLFVLIAVLLAKMTDKLESSPLGNITWLIKLAKVLGIICIILGLLLVLAAIAAIPLIVLAGAIAI